MDNTRRQARQVHTGCRDEKPVPHLSAGELLAWRGLLETEARLVPLLDEELRRRLALYINEFDVLYQLWVAPGGERRMKDLAGALLVTPSGTNRLVTRLEGKGLVKRVSRCGVQAVTAKLTPAGRRSLRQAMDVHFEGVRRLFVDRLTAAELRRLTALWSRLRETPDTTPCPETR